MNIAIYNAIPLVAEKGGIQRISNNLASELMNRGYQVYFLIKNNIYETEVFDEVCEMTILDISSYDEVEAYKKTKEFLINKKINIIINQHYFDSDFPEFMKKNFEIPLITVVHNVPNRLIQDKKVSLNHMAPIFTIQTIKYIIKRFIQPYRIYEAKKRTKLHFQKLYDNSDRVVLLSKRYYPEWSSLVFCSPERMFAIPNFNMEKNTASDEVQYNQKEKMILFVGRIEFVAKRLERLVLVWEKIYKKYPEWKLCIAGDGNERENIENYVKKKKIKNIEFLGFVNPESLYQRASIFCMTSTFEGFPMVLIEASQYGCVPMAFDSFASVNDVIEHKKNGVLIQPFDLDSYQEELEMLMNDDGYRRVLQKEAVKINEKFSAVQIVDQWVALIQAVIEDHHVKNQ